MKILYFYITNNFEGFQGYNVHIKEFMENANLIDDVECVGYRPLATTQKTQAGYINLYSIVKKRVNLPRWSKDFLSFISNFVEFFHGVKRIKEEKPDIIVFRQNPMTFYQVLLKRWFKIPLLLEVNSPLTYEKIKYNELSLKKLHWWAEKVSWKKADHIFTVSGELKNILAETVSADKITPIHNGANIKDYEGLEKGDSSKIRIGFLGAFKKYHGIDVLFNSIPKILDSYDNVEFCLIGHGGLFDEYKNFFDSKPEYKERVILMGNVPYEKVPAQLVKFDIAVMLDFTEYGSPLKMFEYMMAETAMVLPDRKTIHEVVTDGEEALLFEPRNGDEFEKAVGRMISDDELRKKLAANARHKVETEYTWLNNAERVVAELRKLL